jgi:hypothetical protein
MVIGLEDLRRELQSTCFQKTIPKSKTHFISYLNECRRSKRYVVIVGTDARQKPADAARRTLQFALRQLRPSIGTWPWYRGGLRSKLSQVSDSRRARDGAIWRQGGLIGQAPSQAADEFQCKKSHLHAFCRACRPVGLSVLTFCGRHAEASDKVASVPIHVRTPAVCGAP